MEIRKAERKDYPQILQLQSENAPDQLSDEQKRQGFIVSRMSGEELDAINRDLGILVIRDVGIIAGFVCLNRTTHRPRPGVVAALLEKLPLAVFNGCPLSEQRLFLYGPVCLASAYRGKGLLRQLFDTVKQQMRQEFDAGVAFVNDANPHSLTAHVQGLGMQDVLRFTFQSEDYHLLAFELRPSEEMR